MKQTPLTAHIRTLLVQERTSWDHFCRMLLGIVAYAGLFAVLKLQTLSNHKKQILPSESKIPLFG